MAGVVFECCETRRVTWGNQCKSVRGKGKGLARFWTCDLTEGYIQINASYRT